MGLFNFIFGKKKVRSQDRILPIRIKISQRWKTVLENQLALSQESNAGLSYSLKNNPKTAIHTFLEAHSLGLQDKKLRVEKSSSYRYISFDQLLVDFRLLTKDLSSEYEGDIVATIEGLIKLSINSNSGYEHNLQNKYEHLFSNISKMDEGYYASFVLEELDNYKLGHRLFGLMNAYRLCDEQSFENVKEEIIERISKLSVSVKLNNAVIFENLKLLNDYLDVRRTQTLLKGKDKNRTNELKYFKELIQNGADKGELLIFITYEIIRRYSYGLEKDMLKLISEKPKIEYTQLHRLLLIFAAEAPSGNPFSGTLMHKLVKSYFVNEPLDLSSYDAIKNAIVACDTMSRSRKLNEFLLSKKDALYNIHNSEVHEMLHSGILHRPRLFGQYHRNAKEASTYISNLVTLLNQIVPTVLLKDESQFFKIQLGGVEIDLNPLQLYRINVHLQKQNIPYQLVNIPLQINDNKHSRLLSTYLLTEDEFETAFQFVKAKNRDSDEKKNYESVNYISTIGHAAPLNNRIANLKKIQNSQISSNRFIHDIKWKEVKTQLVDNFEDPRLWYGVMHHIVSAPNSVQPSESWMKKMNALSSELGEENYQDGMLKLIEDLKRNSIWFNKDSIKPLRGIIWAISLLSDEVASKGLETVSNLCYHKVPGSGPRSISGGNSCVKALVEMNNVAGYIALSKLKKTTPYERFKNQISEEIRIFERNSKSLVIGVKEAAQESYGFVNGVSELEIKGHKVHWTIKNRKARSQWVDDKGKKLPKSPLKDYSATKVISEKTRDINSGIEDFDRRIQDYIFSDVEWDADSWKKNYLNHSFVGQIITSYLWIIIKSNGQNVSVISNNGSLFNSTEDEVLLDQEDKIVLYHRYRVSQDDIESWKAFFVAKKQLPAMNYFYTLAEKPENLKPCFDLMFNGSSALGFTRVRNSDPVSHAMELLYMDKVAVIEREKEGVGYNLKFYENNIKNKGHGYVEQGELVNEISGDKIPDYVKEAILNKAVSNNWRRGYDKEILDPLMEMPFFKMIETLFERLPTLKGMEHVTYADRRLTIRLPDGVAFVNIPLLTLQKESGGEIINCQYTHGRSPRRNYSIEARLPYVPNNIISALLWSIEQLKDISKVSDYRLSRFLEK